MNDHTDTALVTMDNDESFRNMALENVQSCSYCEFEALIKQTSAWQSLVDYSNIKPWFHIEEVCFIDLHKFYTKEAMNLCFYELRDKWLNGDNDDKRYVYDVYSAFDRDEKELFRAYISKRGIKNFSIKGEDNAK